MAVTLAELAEYLAADRQGPADFAVEGLAEAGSAGPEHICYVNRPEWLKRLPELRAGVVVVKRGVAVPADRPALFVDDAYLAFARLSQLFERRPRPPTGVHPSAVVDPSAKLGQDVSIGPFCVVEADVVIGAGSVLHAGVSVGAGSTIGADCELHPRVTLYHAVHLGDRVRLHAQTVIGADGFGYAPRPGGGWEKICQLGGVIIEDDVEIGAGSAVDRGALRPTRVGRGCIIDNQVHIAHNVELGEYTAIAGCSGVAGSTKIGKRCTVGGFCGISGHLEIVDDVHLNGATTVTKSITEPGHYASCIPAQDVKTWRRNTVRFTQLDSWIERLRALESNSD